MKKTLLAILSIFSLIIIGMLIIIYNLNNEELESDPEVINITEEKVHSYLVNERGYEDEELLKIESSRNPKDANTDSKGYTVEVVFSDESEASYYYKVEGNRVTLIGNSGGAYKHMEE